METETRCKPVPTVALQRLKTPEEDEEVTRWLATDADLRALRVWEDRVAGAGQQLAIGRAAGATEARL